MKRPGRFAAIVTLALAIAFALPSAAGAAAIRQGDDVSIGSGETIRDDVYVFGGNIDVEGTIEGDLIAFGTSVSVGGRVTGDVIAAGSDVDISGEVGESVRVGSGTLTISGSVGEDVVAGTGQTRIRSQATVGRDVMAGTGTLLLDGEVEGDLRAGAGDVTIAGTVGGDADIGSPDIDFRSGGRIEGDLIYRSDRRMDIPEEAVGGRIEFRETERVRRDGGDAATAVLFAMLSWLRGLIGFALLSLIVTLLFPVYAVTAADEVRARPLPSLGIGAAIFFGVPIAAVFAFVIGIIVGGWWIALMLLALYWIALMVSVVLAAAFVGRWLLGVLNRPRVHVVWATLLGLLLLWLILILPFLGGLVLWVAMLFGLGAGAIALWDTARRCRGETVPPAATAAMEPPPPEPMT